MNKPTTSEPDATTPGRPKESGSRQQTQPNQTSQTGSTDRDEQLASDGTEPKLPVKPTGTK